jgi:RHH-type proline utilization regulon transcriptional repressor/proline dehydrogenase/delta 1-pyrroline-5-carboxylate dehydrogenase
MTQAFINDIAASLRANEIDAVNNLKEIIKDIEYDKLQVSDIAKKWIIDIRDKQANTNDMNSFFTKMDLSSEEGISLMCMAEALLRIPDKATLDAFLSEQLSAGGIAEKQRKGWFANAAHWGLVLGAQIVGKKESFWQQCFQGAVKKIGAPLVRSTVIKIMGLLGQHFVMGESIDKAVMRAQEQKKYTYSFDMLGEAAVTKEDAAKYFLEYQNAIKKLPSGADLFANSGVSIKLSALYPRYEWAQKEACVAALVESLLILVKAAKEKNISVTIDAEEADRLVLSLEIFQQVWQHPDINYWQGVGLAVQAYTKASLNVIKYCVQLAKDNNSKIPIRLVKGAYWDYEIKHAQVAGINPAVWSRKITTDVCYLACAKLMLEACQYVYCQFATHNAYTVAAILDLASDKQIEFQCLHGMGQLLYEHVLGQKEIRCRIYAPVGSYKTLLPYLVRRLLENGANNSFVHQLVSAEKNVDDIATCPIDVLKNFVTIENPAIKRFDQLYVARKNSKGEDLNNFIQINKIQTRLELFAKKQYCVGSKNKDQGYKEITGPMSRAEPLGKVTLLDSAQVEQALQAAKQAYYHWSEMPVETRAACLDKAADLLEQARDEFIYLCMIEAGKTWQDSIDEIREAVDFLRYYAQQSREVLVEKICEGPTGEKNIWRPVGRGVILCLSPWNFPLAIFIGQVSAALVAGNTVLAKPASQTAIIAHKMLEILYQAGVPQEVCHLLPGGHKIVAAPLVEDDRVSGIMLTGSTNTAKKIALNLAKRAGSIVPFVAETGGQNAMIVDSSALLEVSVKEVIESAFKSAGQRCSACRVLFLQQEIADEFIHMLKGAMAELVVGDPTEISTDVGPVIDQAAFDYLTKHQEYLATIKAKQIYECFVTDELQGCFFAPRAYEISSLSELKEEVFGPILHIIRYAREDIDKVVESIHATKYGLTVGIHSRLMGFATNLARKFDVGNVYINRNMVGAVVGVQPFGGNNLSGTGPKAGGPWYLTRLSKEQVISINTAAIGGNTELLMIDD